MLDGLDEIQRMTRDDFYVAEHLTRSAQEIVEEYLRRVLKEWHAFMHTHRRTVLKEWQLDIVVTYPVACRLQKFIKGPVLTKLVMGL